MSSTALNILFLCTAHNSLSQRLALVLQDKGHHVTVELAISDAIMIEATELAKPDLILCPFLTKKVPAAIYDKYMTLIVHPGAPGDAGPSAIDWVLLGDNGDETDPKAALDKLNSNDYVAKGLGRSHWGLTVLQAIEEASRRFDAGPIWAFDQFAITLDGPQAPTKASLYRGDITRAAVAASLAAIDRILAVCASTSSAIGPHLLADAEWARLSVTSNEPFLGGKTLTRPLLKPSDRAWDPAVHSAAFVSRRLRASDSQPGAQVSIFGGKNLYAYGGIVEENPIPWASAETKPGQIVAHRDGAVLVSTADGKGVWITHVRRLKAKGQALLPPKLPAMSGLAAVPGLAETLKLDQLPEWSLVGFDKVTGTFQEIFIENQVCGDVKTAFVHFDFYNGACSTSQCQRLVEAIHAATSDPSTRALVLMGGSYFSNGIHLGTCSTAVEAESYRNINAINDCVKLVLEARDIVTFSAIRGNVAAGGLAFATAADFVLAVENAVLNPHYRAVSLYGSEYHSLTWPARAGEERARKFMRGMLPMSAKAAHDIGLVDRVLEGVNPSQEIVDAVSEILSSTGASRARGAPWTVSKSENDSFVDAISEAKRQWFDALPQPIAEYRRQELDFMRLCFTDLRYAGCVEAFVGKAAATATPFRFALHRRHQHWSAVQLDPEEEPDYFVFRNVDEVDVNRRVGVDLGSVIRLCAPPPLAWRLPARRPSTRYISPIVSRSTSRNTTLCDPASPRPRKFVDSITEHKPKRSVVKRVRSLLKLKKVEESDGGHCRTRTISLSKKRESVTHQMACLYSATE